MLGTCKAIGDIDAASGPVFGSLLRDTIEARTSHSSASSLDHLVFCVICMAPSSDDNRQTPVNEALSASGQGREPFSKRAVVVMTERG
jgi:hypothetical protein